MITCNRCGKLVPAGVTSCQYCGAPVTDTNETGAGPKRAASGQSELPAWLESLRVDERPAPSVTEQSNFSAADLVDDGSLPSWMRPGGQDVSGNTGQHAWSNPPTPEPSMERGFSASSLIDEKALPSWMQENKAAPTQAASERNISASSLLQPDAVPDWMKNMPPPRTPQQPSAPVSQSFQAPGQQGQPPLGRNFSAKDLIDESALPSWMSAQGQDKNEPRPQNQNNNGPQSGLSAASLLDPNALPSWMRENEQKPEVSAPPVPGNQPQGQGYQNGLSAPSLIDMNALPEWLRNGGGLSQQGTPACAPGGFGQQQPPQGQGFNAPPRVDNVRVPSRPRGEQGVQEQSEVAANVFASMLGVASNKPPVPGQSGPNTLNGQQSFSGIPGMGQGMFPQGAPQQGQGVPPMPQSPAPGMQQQGQPQWMQGLQPGGSSQGFNQPTQTPSQNLGQGQPQWMQQMGSQQGYPGMGNVPGSQQGYPGMGNQPGFNSYPSASQQNQPGMSLPDSGQGKNAGKTEKRGFLETILGWFSFSR